MYKRQVILFLFDDKDNTVSEITTFVKENYREGTKYVLLHNKTDLSLEETTAFDDEILQSLKGYTDTLLRISAKEGQNITGLKNFLADYAQTLSHIGKATVVTNIRHYEALSNALQAIEKVEEGMQMHLSGDLLAIDIRETLYHLGSITGEVSNEEVLGNIFSRFCIGK